MQEVHIGERMRQAAYMIIALSCMAIAGLLAVIVYQNSQLRPQPELTTSFQAIQMTNGNVLFGRLERAGSAFPVLREVYSLQSKINSETKQVTTTLIKRAQDLKGTDEMFLNAAHILTFEPIQPGSNSDKLLQQARNAEKATTK